MLSPAGKNANKMLDPTPISVNILFARLKPATIKMLAGEDMATIMLRDLDESFVEKVKLFSNKNTASQAFISTADSAFRLALDLHEMTMERNQWRERALRLQRVVDDARSAAALLVEKTGQTDLFT